MGKVIIAGVGGAGAGSDECTATRAELLKGYTAVTADSDDEVVDGTLELTGDASDSQVLAGKTYYNSNPKIKRTGSMVNHGAVALNLNAGASYTVPAGFHNGGGKVAANSLASQTSATATAAHILSGQTAWVNGGKITGNIATLGGQTINPTASRQTVSSSGKYMTGNVVVNAVSNLTAANIKKGAVVGGVTGTFQGYVPTATDLYLRGNNIAGFALANATFESGQITLQGSAVSSVTLTASFNITGYNYINVEGYTTTGSTAARRFILARESGGSYTNIAYDDSTFNAGNYTRSLNISAYNVTATFRITLFQFNPSLYRVWLS